MSAVFDADALEIEEEPFATFKVGGREWHCRSKADINFATLRSWLIAQASGDANGVVMQAEDFYRAVLRRSEVEDFLALMRDPEGALNVGRSGAIIEQLNAKLFGFPTRPSRDSSSGRQTTRRSSKGASRSRGTAGTATSRSKTSSRSA